LSAKSGSPTRSSTLPGCSIARPEPGAISRLLQPWL
jgi:hypothetical protein